MASERASQHAFSGVSALLFASSAALAIASCESMSAMGEMPMSGGWTMSSAWMRFASKTGFVALQIVDTVLPARS
jgi:hypothetical protein